MSQLSLYLPEPPSPSQASPERALAPPRGPGRGPYAAADADLARAIIFRHLRKAGGTWVMGRPRGYRIAVQQVTA